MQSPEDAARGRWAAASPYLLAALLTVTGTLHFVFPKALVPLVPPQLPAPEALVYASGAAELACAAGLAMPRTRRLAAWATVLLFLSVFPGNIQMALDASDRSATYRALTYARLPLQVPLVVWAIYVARVSRRRSS
jgi:uncharacterized membrane protein